MALPAIGIDPQIAKHRSRVAVASRRRDPAAVTEARRDLAEAKLAAYITETVNAAPPLTPAQRDKLALLLHAGGDGGAAA